MRGEERDCYEGDPGTLDVGSCVGGTQVCLETNVWGTCDGQVLPATDLCLADADEDCDGAPADCPDPWHVIAVTGPIVGGIDLAVAPDDSVVLLGYFQGTIMAGGQPFTAADSGAFVVKVTPSGTVEWARALIGPGAAHAFALAVGPSGEIVVVGEFSGDMDFGVGQAASAEGNDGFIWGLDEAGAPQWVETFGGSAGDDAEWARDVAIDAEGNIAITGAYTGAAELGGVELPDAGFPSGAFVAKLTPAREMIFYEAGSYYGFGAVAFAPEGDLLATFRKLLAGAVDIGTGPISEEAFIARFDPAGAPRWTFPFGSTTGESQLLGDLNYLAALGSDGVLYHFTGHDPALDVGGGPLGPGAMFYLAITGAGQHAASAALGQASMLTGTATARAPDGSAFIGGHFSQSSFTVLGQTFTAADPTLEDSFLVWVAPDGSLFDARTFGAAGSGIILQGAAVDSTGSVLVSGVYTGSSVALDSGTLPAGTWQQVFVGRLAWP